MSTFPNARAPSSAKLLLRRALFRIAKAAMRARAQRYPVEVYARCLVVAPHEDDATLGCGGLIIGKRLQGYPVDIACITDGSASHPGHPTLYPAALAEQRRSEELQALVSLGVERTRIHFLEAQDGTLSGLGTTGVEAIVNGLKEILLQVAPDEIFLPCRSDGSSEHDAAFALVRLALERAHMTPRLLEYPVWALWSPQRLIIPTVASRRLWTVNFAGYDQLKQQALGMYRSQVEPTPPWTEPVLSTDFVSFFRSNEEFFFEAVNS